MKNKNPECESVFENSSRYFVTHRVHGAGEGAFSKNQADFSPSLPLGEGRAGVEWGEQNFE